ncbi:MAG: hypothetical protein RO009_11140 [Pseudorhodoplanes sp.]|jgi:uncharacterized protein YjiS (DUF1127 family)|nr:hypothetical protein [Pseudorhodoplanes sp.]
MSIIGLCCAILSKGMRRMHFALKRYRARRALTPMLYFDERMFRDIGFSRADIVECLSAPESERSDHNCR